MAQLVIKNAGATNDLVIPGDTEGECPISVHPLMRLQTLIVFVPCDPSVVLSRGKMSLYFGCLNTQVI
jgi:hypothetical protein